MPERQNTNASNQSLSANSYSLSNAPTSSETRYGTYFLGDYRVVDEIGVGGMASVHLARKDGPGGFQKWIAIKRIHQHLIEDDQFIHMFLDEARIAARISHANVAQVFDLGEDSGTYWIAMEYLHGEPLREVMRCVEEGAPAMGYEIATKIITDAAEGLHAAHDLRGKGGELLGLVHRDVTPHNLFITYEGTTKVVDFGIAKVAGRLSNTGVGTLKGKIAYMSPEQVRGSEIDRRTDVFALGVVLWELTTSHRLFRMENDLETLEKVQTCLVPYPSSLITNYPAELESIVMKALAKDRENRFQTAREFARALQQYMVHCGSIIGPEEVATYVRLIFSDRIKQREAHLQWAAEVTQTINIDGYQAQLDDQGRARSVNENGFAGNPLPRAQVSTRVATPRPAAGMPVGGDVAATVSEGVSPHHLSYSSQASFASAGDDEDEEENIETIVAESKGLLPEPADFLDGRIPPGSYPATHFHGGIPPGYNEMPQAALPGFGPGYSGASDYAASAPGQAYGPAPVSSSGLGAVGNHPAGFAPGDIPSARYASQPSFSLPPRPELRGPPSPGKPLVLLVLLALAAFITLLGVITLIVLKVRILNFNEKQYFCFLPTDFL